MVKESEKNSSDNSREERVRFAKIVLRTEKNLVFLPDFIFETH